MNIVERAKNILITPATEWETIKAENLTVAEMFKKYAMILAVIPAAAGFIGFSLVGISLGLGTYQIPAGRGIFWAILNYVFGLIGVYILSLIVDALAPSFGSTKNIIASTKVIVFSYTAVWVAGIFSIIPGLNFIAIIGALYSLYLLYKGMPIVKDVPNEKTIQYVAVVVILTIVVYIVIGTIVSAIAFGGMLTTGM